MRKLDEQWIEEFDGKMHMYKCIGLNDDMSEIIKDLGILNKDGCLPAPWDETKYPQVYRTTEAIWYAYAESYGIFMEATGKTRQQAIDAWNRRT